MKTTYISTQAASTASRLSILKMQTELAKNTKELSSGRWADVGLELGNKTGRTISLRQDYQRLDAIRDTNGLVASRLDTSQAALDGVLKNAQEFAASNRPARLTSMNVSRSPAERSPGVAAPTLVQ